MTDAARKILYAYGRTHELLDGDYGRITAEMAAEMSEALGYLAEAYEAVTGEKIGPAFLDYSGIAA